LSPQISGQLTHEGGKDVNPKHRLPLLPGNVAGTHFCCKLSPPQPHSAIGRNMSMKDSSGTVGNRTRDLPAWSSMPQTTALPFTSWK